MLSLKPLSLSLLLLTITHSAFSSPVPTDAKIANRASRTLQELGRLSDAELKQIFEVKDHKGESIFKSGRKVEAGTWSTLDPILNGKEGTSTERVYKEFKIPKNKNEVIVAVIDSGVDINHEDLRGKIWINFEEFYGSPGVDDDHDGYVDDIYGWNFIGNKNGQNLEGSNLESVRIYSQLKAKEAAGSLSASEAALLTQVRTEVEDGIESAQKGLTRYKAFAAAIQLLKANGLKEETVQALDQVNSSSAEVLNAKALAIIVFKRGKTSADITDGIHYFESELKYHYNPDFDPSSVIGDHPNTLNEVGYGNSDVTGPDASHGTHVAGIIAANRDNRFGINGQGRNIKIMSLRAVPDGDERDKDVANAIRFATDHGARVINMSFGKPYSPNKAYVEEATKYAESKGVLLVHAAGNDGKSTESGHNNFPNRLVNNGRGVMRTIETWIEVGASSETKGQNLPADFSNYGKSSVDVFAPGVGIVSTIPGNQYASFNGTSMASPEVAGVAALLLEKWPFASAKLIKKAILTTTNQYPGLSCITPGSEENGSPIAIPFSELSATGGTVNAYEAMKWLFANGR